MDYSNFFVCLMGLGTVFFGLICLIVLTILLGRICGAVQKASASAPTPAPASTAVSVPNQEELVAAISAAIAEELGTDITGIRILSIKKL